MKNKKCEKCNKKSMKTFYIRSYYKGTSFLTEKPYFREITKQEWKSIGLICTNCFNIDITDDVLKYYWNIKQDKEKQLIKDFREVEMEFAKYKYDNRKNVYSKKEMDKSDKFTERIMLHRFWNIKGDIQTYGFLKGLKENRELIYTAQDLKDRELTDDQILKKAKLIETRIKLGYN